MIGGDVVHSNQGNAKEPNDHDGRVGNADFACPNSLEEKYQQQNENSKDDNMLGTKKKIFFKEIS